jgi:hypothetical protein
MSIWSITMIIAFGFGRLRNVGQILVLTLATAVVLVLSAGLDPSSVLSASSDFLRSGLLGWLALLVMPCGWLGPMVGLNLVHRLYKVREEIA